MHAATEAIAMLASLTSFLLWLPQGARVWKHRHDPSRLAGIAMSSQVIALAGNVLWGVYAVLVDSFWLGAPAVVNGPIAVLTIVVLRRGTTATRRPVPAPVVVPVVVPAAVTGVVQAAMAAPAARAAVTVREVRDIREVRELQPA